MVLDTCPDFAQLDVAQFMDDAAGFFAEDHKNFLGFLRSSLIDFVSEHFLNFPLLLGLGPFAFHPSRLHREQFLQF